MCLRIYCFGVQEDPPPWILYFKWILPIIITLVLYCVLLECVYHLLKLFVSVLLECKFHKCGSHACFAYLSILETEIMDGLIFVE